MRKLVGFRRGFVDEDKSSMAFGYGMGALWSIGVFDMVGGARHTVL